MGVIPPLDDFLDFLRSITQTYESLLIFDEVITGFRVARGGAQERYGILPDLTTLGKIIGGGLPVGAYGGKAEIMDTLSPDGPVYQAGTLSGNPLAVAAGLATLNLIDETPDFYSGLDTMGDRLMVGLEEAAVKHDIPAVVNRVGSMMTCFFTDLPKVTTYETAMSADKERYAKYFHAMLDRGIYLAPSQFEAAFVSSVHNAKDVDKTIAAADEALGELKNGRV
jgi:glutamate-1-semialdehyde 2,1-aminomutase